jgi:hypothetical protein
LKGANRNVHARGVAVDVALERVGRPLDDRPLHANVVEVVFQPCLGQSLILARTHAYLSSARVDLTSISRNRARSRHCHRPRRHAPPRKRGHSVRVGSGGPDTSRRSTTAGAATPPSGCSPQSITSNSNQPLGTLSAPGA